MQLLTVTASKRTDPQKLYKINYSLGKAKYIISVVTLRGGKVGTWLLRMWTCSHNINSISKVRIKGGSILNTGHLGHNDVDLV